MTGWCPYKSGTLEEQECHFDGYCRECEHNKSEVEEMEDRVATVYISEETASALIAFIKRHERNDIPDDVWDFCMKLYEIDEFDFL